MELTSENVVNTGKQCMFPTGTTLEYAKENGIIVQGITENYAFMKEGVERNKEEIHSMLLQLPTEFLQGDAEETNSLYKKGGSFLKACVREDGEQWTSLHRNIEHLICLGIAIGKVEYCAPRELWRSLPGGMPYFRVLN